MKQNEYGKLMERISTPPGLNQRVMRAAHREAVRETTPRQSRRRRPILRPVVCAACAMALVLGGLYLRPAKPGIDGKPGGQTPPVVGAPAYTFGLAAYAAESGAVLPMEGGELAFFSSNGVAGEDIGDYTDPLFLCGCTGLFVQGRF